MTRLIRNPEDAYSVARALINDPRPAWGQIPVAETTTLRRLLRDLCAEVDWQRLRAETEFRPCGLCAPGDGGDAA